MRSEASSPQQQAELFPQEPAVPATASQVDAPPEHQSGGNNVAESTPAEASQELLSSSSVLASSENNQLGGLAIDSNAYRLKVVNIPLEYTEDQLRSLFALCGSVVEARIVIDKASGRPVGYGYVSYNSKEAADLAISTFDDQLQLQGAGNCLSVYYAKKQHDTVQEKESCPARNAKLYFCGTPSSFRRDSILALFSAFGRVRHLQVYTDSFGVLASGTVTMYSTEEATAAMNSLDGKVLQPGTAPLKVTWAQLSTLPRRSPAGGGPPPPMPKGFTVSYACIPTSVTPSEVAAMFERFGMVLQVVPFAHRREGAANSRGCGLVVMESEYAARDAMEALSNKFTWPGSERPLLLQPFYGAERVGPHQLPTLPEGGGPASSSSGSQGPGGPGSGGGGGGRPRPSYQQQQQQGYRSSGGDNSGDRGRRDHMEQPPPGCAPDAFKLVLSNLPSSYSHADIAALLQPYGTVVAVLHQPSTSPSVDSPTTVWYANGAQAESALTALCNIVLIAPDGPRKLLVKAPGYRGLARSSPGYGVHMGHGGATPRQHQQMSHDNSSSGMDSGSASTAGGYMPQLVYQQQYQQPQQQQQLQQQQQQMVMQFAYNPPGVQQAQQQGMQLVQGQSQEQVIPLWLSNQAGIAPPVSSASSAGLQFAGLAGGQPGNRGTFDMQQLMYVLPNNAAMQQPAVSGSGPGQGQLWPMAAGQNMLMPGQQVHVATGMTNSGSTLEQMQAVSDQVGPGGYLANQAPGAGAAMAPPASAPPGVAYTGWLC